MGGTEENRHCPDVGLNPTPLSLMCISLEGSGVYRFFFFFLGGGGGGGLQNQLRTEGGRNGDLGAVAP
jgi:hypothetical protein